MCPRLRNADHPCRGFTLIELLIVTVIISFLGIVLYTTFYQGIALWHRAQTDLGEFRDAWFNEKLTSDLHNIIPMGRRLVRGSEKKFEFYALVPGRELGQKGDGAGLLFPCRLRYDFDAGTRQVTCEVQSYSQILMEAKENLRAAPVFEHVRDVHLEYYGRAEKPVIIWQRRWEKECLPDAVKVSVEYEDKKQPFVRIIDVPGGGCRVLNPKAA